jgi:hypothetical protein
MQGYFREVKKSITVVYIMSEVLEMLSGINLASSWIQFFTILCRVLISEYISHSGVVPAMIEEDSVGGY